LAKDAYKYDLNVKESAWLAGSLYAAGSETVSGLPLHLMLSTYFLLKDCSYFVVVFASNDGLSGRSEEGASRA